MSFYHWKQMTQPILFGLHGVMVIRHLHIRSAQYATNGIPVPLFRGVAPIYVAADSSLPAGYDVQYDYQSGLLRVYRWDGTAWGEASSIPQDFNFRVLFIYETVKAS